MSALLDSLCGATRLADIAANERAMDIFNPHPAKVELVEQAKEAVSMENCGVDE